MSNYIARTRNPETGAWEDATWVDHGLSRYTVRFADGREFAEAEVVRAEAKAFPGDDLSYYLGPSAVCATAEQCAELEAIFADAEDHGND